MSLPARKKALRKFAEGLGMRMLKIVVENDIDPDTGRMRSASAYKTKTITLPNGRKIRRVMRDGFEEMLLLLSGPANALVTEDLDRLARDQRDLADLKDVVQIYGRNVRSLSGSLTFTNGGTDTEIMMAEVSCAMAAKSSRDTARRVSAARLRQAQEGRHGGGKRRFGFESDGITVRESEAKAIRECCRRVLQVDQLTGKRIHSLRALAMELREGDVPTASGTRWTPPVLKDVLIKPRNAGIAVHQGKEIGLFPTKIVDVVTYRAVVAVLCDPSRSRVSGPAPKYLGSGIYQCGMCGGDTTVKINPSTRWGARYVCKEKAHLARQQAEVDKLVEWAVLERLARPDAVHLVPVVEVPEVDTAGLQAKAESIRANLKSLGALRALGHIDDATLIEGTRTGRTELERITALLNTALVDSPLTRFVEAQDVEAEWMASPMDIRRAVLSELLDVTLVTGRGYKLGVTVHIAPKE